MESPNAATATAYQRSTPYWWFSGASVIELARQLEEVGPAVARLEIHKNGDIVHFQVIDPSAVVADDDCPPINESHICPPQC